MAPTEPSQQLNTGQLPTNFIILEPVNCDPLPGLTNKRHLGAKKKNNKKKKNKAKPIEDGSKGPHTNQDGEQPEDDGNGSDDPDTAIPEVNPINIKSRPSNMELIKLPEYGERVY